MPHDAFLSRFLALAAVVFALNGPVNSEGLSDAAFSDEFVVCESDEDAADPVRDRVSEHECAAGATTAGKRET